MIFLFTIYSYVCLYVCREVVLWLMGRRMVVGLTTTCAISAYHR